MEFEVNISQYLKVDSQGFLIFSGRDCLKQIKPHHQEHGLKMLTNIINTLGQRSAKSQKLKQIITTYSKFVGSDQRIYIKTTANLAVAFLKVGEKKLFYHDFMGAIKELDPTSVLDIYVHQSCQRSGVGKEIFQKFLQKENKIPEKLAYDRPSEKLISFLKKHYNLSSHIPQNNNYVIFDRYFGKNQKNQKQFTEQKQQQPSRIVIPSKEVHSSNIKNRTMPMVEKVDIFNIQTTHDQEDSLSKLTKDIKKISFEPNNSYKNVKDQTKSSFGCPWAIEEKMGFRTTSNAYGNYYRKI